MTKNELTVSRRDMRPVERAVEQLRHIRFDACGVDLDAAEELVPLVERGLAGAVEVEGRDFGLCVRTGLFLRDERDTRANEDRSGLCGGIVSIEDH